MPVSSLCFPPGESGKAGGGGGVRGGERTICPRRLGSTYLKKAVFIVKQKAEKMHICSAQVQGKKRRKDRATTGSPG